MQVKDTLTMIFHTFVPCLEKEDKHRAGAPPDPLREDSFCAAVLRCYEKYMRMTTSSPLDNNVTDKLLDASGRVYDFSTRTLRASKPEERLCSRTARDIRPWGASADLRDAWDEFGRVYQLFRQKRGTSLHKAYGDAELQALASRGRELLAFILAHPDSHMAKAMAHVLVSDGDSNSLDTLVWLWLHDAKLFASKPRLIGMLVASGPRNCTKSWLVGGRIINFLGQAAKNYCLVVDGIFASNQPRADSQASVPLTNRFRGKKMVSSARCPPGRYSLEPSSLCSILRMATTQHGETSPMKARRSAVPSPGPSWGYQIATQRCMLN